MTDLPKAQLPFGCFCVHLGVLLSFLSCFRYFKNFYLLIQEYF